MEYNEHGGCCCGMSHIYSFPHAEDKGINALGNLIKEGIEEIEESRLRSLKEEGDEDGEEVLDAPWKVFGHLIEVVLTDWQMSSGWSSVLKEKGFKLGPRWFNDNSGNYCNLLTYQTKEPETPPPYVW